MTPRIGVTLYSLTLEYRAGKYTFEELVRRAGELGVGPPVEIVGFQSIRGFPAVSDEFALRFRRLSTRRASTPSCLGANIDTARRRDRLMTTRRPSRYISAQIDAAVKLGFPVLRIQFGARAGGDPRRRTARREGRREARDGDPRAALRRQPDGRRAARAVRGDRLAVSRLHPRFRRVGELGAGGRGRRTARSRDVRRDHRAGRRRPRACSGEARPVHRPPRAAARGGGGRRRAARRWGSPGAR